MTDLRFLSSCDKLRKEDLSTRRVYKPRRCSKNLNYPLLPRDYFSDPKLNTTSECGLEPLSLVVGM